MIFSYNWLKEYVHDLPSPAQLEEQLTLHSVEVEGVTDAATQLAGIVVGVVESVEKHPDADRLSVCMVNDGEGQQPVVCGGSNLEVGMRTAFGRLGAKVQWHGEGDLVELAPAKIRGVESRGMICAADEIGLAELFPKSGEKEIVNLNGVTDAAPGTPLSQALGLEGALIDIDNKSMTHRSDLFCHTGLSREIAAVFDKKVSLPTLPALPEGKETLAITIEEPELCPRYMAAHMQVQVLPTPDYIAARLQECGVKSINNVVDITNYVMLEWGEPMHAFDADTLEGDITVRKARDGEKITTLDKEEKELHGELVIADSKKPIAVAGVIGGLHTGVSEKTTQIILEAATFDALTVRHAATAVGVRTDSAMRWEKGIPVERAEQGMARAIELLQKHAAAEVMRFTDVGVQTSPQKEPIELTVTGLRRLSGVDFESTQVTKLLGRLECSVDSAHEGNDTAYHVSPPWFRQDLQIPEDIIEEIVRLYGPQEIPQQQLSGVLGVPPLESELIVQQEIVRLMNSFGATEVYNYSFYGDDLMSKCGFDAEVEHLEIDNPLSDDLRYLRTSLLPRLLENVVHNQQYRDTLSLYELGHLYFADRESQQFGIVVTGENATRRARGLAEGVLRAMGIDFVTERIEKSADCPFWNAYAGGQALAVSVGGSPLGTIGGLDSGVARALNIKGDVGFALLSVSELSKIARQNQPLLTPSAFPAITLDWSVIVDEATPWADLEAVVRTEAGDLLKSIQVFDVYHGEKIPAGKKSVAFEVILQSHKETLEMKKIEQWRDQLMAKLQKQFGVELRDK